MIGFFDGVHRGHLHLVNTLLVQARQRAMRPIAVTFRQPPRRVLQPQWQPQLLTTPEERRQLLAQAGAEEVVMLDFTPELAQLTAREFMQQVLLGQLDVRLLVVGYDTRFGHDRRETTADYISYGREMGMEVVQAGCVEGCSSSAVRRLLAAGEVEQAAGLLGRHYVLRGSVVHGQGNGRRMGFPTANVQPDDEWKMLPAAGVYATRTRMEGGQWVRSMTDIGMRPTFHGSQLTVETHLLGMNDDLYGKQAEVMFCRWMRAERPFDSPEELRRQLVLDAQQAGALDEGATGLYAV